MKRKWKESEEMERVVRACLVPIFLTTNPIDTISIDTCSLQGPILQYFQHCCLCPLPKIKEKRNTHFMFCVTKVFALIQKLLVLCNVQCAAPQQDAMSWLLLLLTLPQRFSSFFAFHFALTRHLNIYKQMIFFEGHIRQKFIFLSYNFFVLKVDGDTCILFEELKWIRCGKTIRTEKGDTSLCCLSAK